MELWMRRAIDDFVARHGTVPPPWVVYDQHPYSICWRMGGGESHLMLWRQWWPAQGFTEEQRLAYFRRWPPPHCWLTLLIEAVWGVDTFEERDHLDPYFERTAALGFGGRLDYERDLDDPKWLEKGDPHELDRFLRAQEDDYERALAEVRGGRKLTHWMWYVFPQYEGLGSSPTARRYAIRSVAEAEAYLRHPVLGPRLVECAEAANGVEGRTALQIFGSPDDLKLRSCATLFAAVSPPGSVFHRLLDRFFQGRPDDATLRLIGTPSG